MTTRYDPLTKTAIREFWDGTIETWDMDYGAWFITEELRNWELLDWKKERAETRRRFQKLKKSKTKH